MARNSTGPGNNGGFRAMYVYIGIGLALSVAILAVVIFFILRMRRNKNASTVGQETKKVEEKPKVPEQPKKEPTTIIKAPDPPKDKNLTPSTASDKATESVEEKDPNTETAKTDYTDKTPESVSHPTQPSVATSGTLITDVSTASATQNDIFEHLGEGKEPKLTVLEETRLNGVLVNLKERLARKEDSLERRLVEAKALPVLLGLFAKRNLSIPTLKLLAECLEMFARTNRTDLHASDMKKALVSRLQKIDKSSAALYPHILTLFIECQPDNTPRLTCSSGYVPLAKAAPIWLETVNFTELEWDCKIEVVTERSSQLNTMKTTITVLTNFLKEGLNVVASERSLCIEFVLSSLEKILNAMKKSSKLKSDLSMKHTLKFVCYGIYAISNHPDTKECLIEPKKRLVMGIRAIVDLGLLSEAFTKGDPNEHYGLNLRKLLLNILVGITSTRTGASHAITVNSDLIQPSAIHGVKEIRHLAEKIKANMKHNHRK